MTGHDRDQGCPSLHAGRLSGLAAAPLIAAADLGRPVAQGGKQLRRGEVAEADERTERGRSDSHGGIK